MKNRNMLSDMIGNRRRTMFWLVIATVLCIQAAERWPKATAFMERRRACAAGLRHGAETNAYNEKMCLKSCDAGENVSQNVSGALDCMADCFSQHKYYDDEDGHLEALCNDGDKADYARAQMIWALRPRSGNETVP